MPVTAEIGVNWKTESDFLDLAVACVEAGADAVKGQYFRERDIHDHPDRAALRWLCMTPSRAWRLMELLRKQGIELYWTPENTSCVQDLVSIGVHNLKVSHVQSRNSAMLNAVSKTGLPTIFSLDPHDGKGGLAEFQSTLHRYGMAGCPVMYCRSLYPTPVEEHHYEVAMEFGGFSCHTRDITVIRRMKDLLDPDVHFFEYHVRPDTGQYLDQDVSFTASELKALMEP